jgi:hypothetical protein
MSIFVTITTNLPKNKDSYFQAVSEQEYILSGLTSPTTKILYVDDDMVDINPYTFTWSKVVKAPKTGAKFLTSHVVKAFGHENNIHQLTSSFNSVNVLVLPPC